MDKYLLLTVAPLGVGKVYCHLKLRVNLLEVHDFWPWLLLSFTLWIVQEVPDSVTCDDLLEKVQIAVSVYHWPYISILDDVLRIVWQLPSRVIALCVVVCSVMIIRVYNLLHLLYIVLILWCCRLLLESSIPLKSLWRGHCLFTVHYLKHL